MALPFKIILVPTDSSATGDAAIPVAFDLARKYDGRVVLVHVVDVGSVSVPMYGGAFLAPSAEDVQAMMASAIKALRERIPAGNPAVPFEIQVSTGPAATEICRLAEAAAASLIVIASHGRTGIKRILLGSVAERVLRHAPCAVLVHR